MADAKDINVPIIGQKALNQFNMSASAEKKVQVFEGGPYFSLKGNGQFGQVTRTGWRPSRLGQKKQQIIAKALKDSLVDEVYWGAKRHIYKRLLNGQEVRIC